MNLLSRISDRVVSIYSGRPGQTGTPPLELMPPAHLYRMLKAYAFGNDLYDDVNRALYQRGSWREAMKPLRNPAFRVVQFHAATLWPGALAEAFSIDTDHEAILAPIAQVWTWSNWAAQKQVAARQLAMLGDLFIKVVQTEDRSRVYFQLIDPEHVSDFDTDERGFITYIRVDIPRTERDGDTVRPVTHTEVWDTEQYRVWVHTKAEGETVDRLGAPDIAQPLSTIGISFVPFVHAKFRDVGALRGQGVFTPALDKIDEANRMATRLHQLLFRHNDVTWALRANGVDAAQRPLPGVRLENQTPSGGFAPQTVKFGDDQLLSLPGTATLESLIPDIKYADALAILNAMLVELRHDLPELVYDDLAGMDQASGIAVRLRMTGAIDRVIEARGNAEAALIRANQMALTLGAAAGLFAGIGVYEAGDFDHSFAPRPVVPMTEQERAAVDLARAQTADALVGLIGAEAAIREALPDWTDEQVQAALNAKAAEVAQGNEQALALAAAQQMAQPAADTLAAMGG